MIWLQMSSLCYQVVKYIEMEFAKDYTGALFLYIVIS